MRCPVTIQTLVLADLHGRQPHGRLGRAYPNTVRAVALGQDDRAHSVYALLTAMLCVLVFAMAWPCAGDTPAEPPIPVATPASPKALSTTIATERISLSHTDPKRCLDMLKVFGYQTCEPGSPVNVDSLPCVIIMPSTTGHDLPDEKKKNFPQTDTDPVTDLLVFYERDKPEQFSRLLERVRKTLDTPARQIMIEALVLEIGSGELNQLGVEWELNRGGLSGGNWFDSHSTGTMRIGNVDLADGGGAIIDPTIEATVSNIFGHFETQIQALIVAKSARVLSRPSVLTLDNRMASIDVSEKIPVAESTFAANGNFTQVSFRELTAGIQLLVRPRVSADGNEIGMQISATVTARKPGEDVIINATGPGGELYEVARSPTLTVREVKTFARIANNTPFIIGGLVAQDDNSTRRKVPILGSIPLIGGLFGSKDESNSRREVIIVITPHVLEDEKSMVQNLPKDVDDFDSFGAELFRDAYRIRAEDVFNLRFLTENLRLKTLQKMADEIVATNAELAEVYPFKDFYQGRFPGEEILVYRQIYEVIKRRELAAEVDEQRLIFLTAEGLENGGIGVSRLGGLVQKLVAKEPGLRDICADSSDDRERQKRRRLSDGEPSKALALTFTERKDADADLADVLLQPVPKVEIVDCPDRKAWEEKLWDMNQPDIVTGLARFSVLLRDEEDLLRLKRAIMLRRTVDLNGSKRQMALKNFALGHVLRIPTIKADKFYLIDRRVAKYFFFTEHYYRAVGRELDKDVAAFDKAVERLNLEPAADQ